MTKVATGRGSAAEVGPLASGAVNNAAVRALFQEEDLAKAGHAMRWQGYPPDVIESALRAHNNRFSDPLNEDVLGALIAKYTEDYEAKLARVPMTGFMRNVYPSPRFVIDQLVPRNEVTLGGGHGGSGKSILFLTLAAHVACGKIWDRFEVERSRVVFVSLEDQAAHVMYRLQKIIKTYLLEPAAVETNLQVFDGSCDPELMIEYSDRGRHILEPTQMFREVEAAAAGAGLIIIDNASDAYGGNENSRRDVRAFIRELGRIARVNDAGVILLAHIDKNAARYGGNGNNYSGSTAWHNSTRSRLALVEVEGEFQLHHEKHNRSTKSDPVSLMWTEDGVLVPGKSATAAAARAQRAQSEADAALRAILKAHSSDILVPAAATGTSTSWGAVSHLPEMKLFETRDGKRRFHAALQLLRDNGFLVHREFRTEQRKTRIALELTSKGIDAAQALADGAAAEAPGSD